MNFKTSLLPFTFCLLPFVLACAPALPPNPERPWFTEGAEAAGLKFTHVNGLSGKFYYAEIIGSGAALFDYDNDGDLDVYLAQGRPLDSSSAAGLAEARSAKAGRLFRNDLTVGADGTRTLKFTDVTDASRIVATGYGMGAAAGDFNNDGCVDLYLTNLGTNQLWRNNCDGTFTDVAPSAHAAVGATHASPLPWSVSAAFVDFDRDGWLDLFVGTYLNWSVGTNTSCSGPSGRPDYCSPNVYSPQPSRLFHNNRDGTFSDVTQAAGMASEFGPALGVIGADVNNDGWIDLYVANDGQPNQLWINQRNGTFKNTGLLSGAAMNARGKAKAGMGVAAGDFDGDGDEDLFVTNLRGEGNDLYVNDGSGLFEEQSERSGLGPGSLPFTGFGATFVDVDNDGWLDVLVVNGAVQTIEALRQANDPFPLHQPKRLFRNLGNGPFDSAQGKRFEDATARGGAALQLSEVSRGAAFGDVDNDGDIDVVIANNNGPARLIVNEVGSRSHWIGVRVINGKRDMLGARVGVVRSDGVTLWRRARTDGSYASASDPRVVVGLGQVSAPVTVRVTWPDGKTEEWTNVAIDKYTTLQQGRGNAK